MHWANDGWHMGSMWVWWVGGIVLVVVLVRFFSGRSRGSDDERRP